MKLTGGRIETFLQSPPRDTVGALLFGPDRGLVRERAERLSRHWATDPDDAFGVSRLTEDDLADDPARLSDAMTALSLLGSASLVRLRLDTERQGKRVADVVKDFDSNPDRAASRLVIEAGDAKAGGALRKAVEASRHFAAIGCYPDGARDVAQLIRDALDGDGLSIRPDALSLWMERLSGDRALIRAEIEKMALYCGPGSGHAVTVEDVEAVSAGAQAATLDEIVGTVMGGRPREADGAIRRALDGKVNPVLILISLQRHILRLQEASDKTRGGMGAEAALKSLRPPVFFSQLPAMAAQLEGWNPAALRQALAQSLQVEERVKSAGAPVDALVGRFALALAGYAQGRVR